MKIFWIILSCFLTINGIASPLFSGVQYFNNDFQFNNLLLGGLSGITYDEKNDLFFAISDDPGRNAPSRIFEFKLDTVTNKLIVQNAIILSENVDGEGIVRLPSGDFVIGIESIVPSKNYIKVFNPQGKFLNHIEVNEKFIPYLVPGIRGVGINKAFESMALTPDKEYLFTANEYPLVQDERKDKSIVRIVKFKKIKNTFTEISEYAYQLEAKVENGIVDIIALSENKILTLERAYEESTNKISSRIYETDLKNQKNYLHVPSFKDKNISTVSKKLLFDLDTILPSLEGKHIDNIEGMTFGPPLKNGKRILILMADNNFSDKQFNQFIFLEY